MSRLAIFCHAEFDLPCRIFDLPCRIFDLPCRIFTCRAVPCRNSIAVKNIHKRIEQFEEERWRDMGAIFLTFAVYTHPDGRLVVDR